MARNQPFDFSDDDDLGIISSHPGTGDSEIISSGSSPTTYSSSSSSGSLGANGLSSADMELAGMGEDLIGTGSSQSGRQGSRSSMAQEAAQAAQAAAQQTKTAARSSTGQHDSPTSMAKKRGNTPR